AAVAVATVQPSDSAALLIELRTPPGVRITDLQVAGATVSGAPGLLDDGTWSWVSVAPAAASITVTYTLAVDPAALPPYDGATLRVSPGCGRLVVRCVVWRSIVRSAPLRVIVNGAPPRRTYVPLIQ
ncbi:MAG TPA: hypothetical protein PKK15_05940, partial [Kouleothrix sp.]|nr:hypothetical protein [Kouleothrix sp.]